MEIDNLDMWLWTTDCPERCNKDKVNFHFRLKEGLLMPEDVEILKQIVRSLSVYKSNIRYDGGDFLIKREDVDRFAEAVIKIDGSK